MAGMAVLVFAPQLFVHGQFHTVYCAGLKTLHLSLLVTPTCPVSSCLTFVSQNVSLGRIRS